MGAKVVPLFFLFLLINPSSPALIARDDADGGDGGDGETGEEEQDVFSILSSNEEDNGVATNSTTKCYECGSAGNCLSSCGTCSRTWKLATSGTNESVEEVTENTTLHCPSASSGGVGQCVGSCATGCVGRPFVCSGVCVASCRKCNNSTMQWGCASTEQCVPLCPGECPGHIWPPATTSRDFDDEVRRWEAAQTARKAPPASGGTSGLLKVFFRSIWSYSAGASDTGTSMFRWIDVIPTAELKQLYSVDGTCQTNDTYARAGTLRCRLASNAWQQCMLMVQGIMMFLHVFSIFIFTRVIRSTKRAYNLLVKKRISESAVILTALTGGTIMLQRVAFMTNHRTACLGHGRTYATELSSFRVEVTDEPGWMIPEICFLIYITMSFLLAVYWQPEVSSKDNAAASSRLQDYIWQYSGWSVICKGSLPPQFVKGDRVAVQSQISDPAHDMSDRKLHGETGVVETPHTGSGFGVPMVEVRMDATGQIQRVRQDTVAIDADGDGMADGDSTVTMVGKRKCLANRFENWKWDALYFRLKSEGLIKKPMVEMAVSSYLGYWNSVWSNFFLFAYSGVLTLIPWALAMYIQSVVSFIPLNHRGGLGHLQYAASGIFVAALVFIGAAYYSYLRCIHDDDWHKYLCSRDKSGSVWEVHTDKAFFRGRCENWRKCMECDGLIDSALDECNKDSFTLYAENLPKLENRNNTKAGKLALSWAKAARTEWVDRQGLCWALAYPELPQYGSTGGLSRGL